MAPLKEPVERLSLALRKNLRDNWEAKRPELESKISQLLGETWTISVNPNLLYAYAEDDSGKERLGDVIMWYMEPFVDNLSAFLKSFGEDGKSELNSYCSKHQLVFAPQDSTTFTYGGLEVRDGTLRIVFAEHYLGSNTTDASREIGTALKDAPAPSGSTKPALNIIARNAIRDDYDPKIEAIRESIAQLVGMPNIKLNPNWDHNAAELLKHAEKTSSTGWDQNIACATYSYFEGVRDQMDRQGFKGDDMLQEGFQEGISKGEICVRIVDKLVKGYYNEVVIENGVLYVQTTPENWYCNVGSPAENLLDLL